MLAIETPNPEQANADPSFASVAEANLNVKFLFHGADKATLELICREGNIFLSPFVVNWISKSI